MINSTHLAGWQKISNCTNKWFLIPQLIIRHSTIPICGCVNCNTFWSRRSALSTATPDSARSCIHEVPSEPSTVIRDFARAYFWGLVVRARRHGDGHSCLFGDSMMATTPIWSSTFSKTKNNNWAHFNYFTARFDSIAVVPEPTSPRARCAEPRRLLSESSYCLSVCLWSCAWASAVCLKILHLKLEMFFSIVVQWKQIFSSAKFQSCDVNQHFS